SALTRRRSCRSTTAARCSSPRTPPRARASRTPPRPRPSWTSPPRWRPPSPAANGCKWTDSPARFDYACLSSNARRRPTRPRRAPGGQARPPARAPRRLRVGAGLLLGRRRLDAAPARRARRPRRPLHGADDRLRHHGGQRAPGGARARRPHRRSIRNRGLARARPPRVRGQPDRPLLPLQSRAARARPPARRRPRSGRGLARHQPRRSRRPPPGPGRRRRARRAPSAGRGRLQQTRGPRAVAPAGAADLGQATARLPLVTLPLRHRDHPGATPSRRRLRGRSARARLPPAPRPLPRRGRAAGDRPCRHAARARAGRARGDRRPRARAGFPLRGPRPGRLLLRLAQPADRAPRDALGVLALLVPRAQTSASVVGLLALAGLGCPKKAVPPSPRAAAPAACFEVTAADNSPKTRELFAARRCQGGGVTWAGILDVLAARQGHVEPVTAPTPGWAGAVYTLNRRTRFSIDDESGAARFCADDRQLLATMRREVARLNAAPDALTRAMGQASALALECFESDGAAPTLPPTNPLPALPPAMAAETHAAAERLKQALHEQPVWCFAADDYAKRTG